MLNINVLLDSISRWIIMPPQLGIEQPGSRRAFLEKMNRFGSSLAHRLDSETVGRSPG
jgi:hypothetical protein